MLVSNLPPKAPRLENSNSMKIISDLDMDMLMQPKLFIETQDEEILHLRRELAAIKLKQKQGSDEYPAEFKNRYCNSVYAQNFNALSKELKNYQQLIDNIEQQDELKEITLKAE